jgi:RNA polymerase sigma-70 factor (ECF subfamily)
MLILLNKLDSTKKEISNAPKEEQLIWLMEEYGDMVIRLAYTYVKQKQIAEDISQEVFISCYQSLDRFQNKATYKTWLYRITVNKCKDYLKSWSFKSIFYKDFYDSFFINHSKTPEPAFSKFEEKEVIFENVLGLTVKLREVVILHYYEELSISEISSLLHVNTNTIKTRLHRARQVLKGLLEGESLDGR